MAHVPPLVHLAALASRGVDQRVIDTVGHSTDERRRRYRHLYPDVTQQAVLSAFTQAN